MMVHLFLAQAGNASQNAAQDIIKQNEAIGREIQIATQQTWIDVLQGPLFVSICNVAAILFALSFLAFGLIWLRHALHPKSTLGMVTFEKIFVVALITILIGTPVNRGKLLGSVVLNLHYVQIGVANFIVSGLSGEVQKDIIGQAGAKQEVELIFAQETEKCLNVDDAKKRDFCLLRVDDRIKGLLTDYQNTGWAQELYDRYHRAIQDLVSKNSKEEWDPLGSVATAASNVIGGIGGGVSYLVIRGVLLSLGSAYLLTLEYAGMLTGLICPFFISATLVKDQYDPLGMWAVAYFGIGFATILYKIVLGLVSLTILKSPPTDALVMPMVLSIGAIFLSIILTRAGGIAILSGAGSFVSGRR
jgi:hypothetical protein